MFSFSPSSTFSDRLDVVASAPLGPFSILYTLRLSSCRSDLPFIPHVERHFGGILPRKQSIVLDSSEAPHL